MGGQEPNRLPKPLEAEVVAVGAAGPNSPAPPARESVVFDLDGVHVSTVVGLSWLLTAQRVAHDARRLVWIKDASARTWAILRAAGVDNLFLPFPEPGPESN